MDSRSTSLCRGMRDHPPASVGEEMSQVQSGSCEGPILGAKREGHLHRLSSSGYPWSALQGPSGEDEGVQQREEAAEEAEGSEVRQLRDLRNQNPKEWECQVLSALRGRQGNNV